MNILQSLAIIVGFILAASLPLMLFIKRQRNYRRYERTNERPTVDEFAESLIKAGLDVQVNDPPGLEPFSAWWKSYQEEQLGGGQ